jgi:hypothetical protein
MMKSEIKSVPLFFRVWDKALSRWVEEYQCGTHAMTETYISLSGDVVKFSAGFPEWDKKTLWGKESDSCFCNGRWWAEKNRYEVCRGTGLFYKSGDEAFEGDIVNTMPARYKITYKAGAFYCEWVEGLNSGKDILLANLIEHAIYIGNIFETPEKLKVI